MTAIYSLRNLKHAYGRHTTLDIESLDVPAGGVLGLVGPNGSGKSTLLKVLALLEPITGGELLFEGERANGREKDLRRFVTLLLQEPYLLRRSVRDNIVYGMAIRGEDSDRAACETLVSESLERVGLDPAKFAPRPWYRLSGGEASRVALAVRLALRPKVLLLDEPTANVDESSAMLIKEAVWSEWRGRGTTIVVATHDLVWLHEVATDVVNLYGGRVIGHGAENILAGNWEMHGDYAVRKVGGSGVIRAALPREKNGERFDCAALNPSAVSLAPYEAAEGGENAITGVIAQISLETGTNRILLTVDCSGLILKARVEKDAFVSQGLYPGQRVLASFDKTSIRWF